MINNFKALTLIAFFYVSCTFFCYAQNNSSIPITLNDLGTFKNPGKDWSTVADVSADFGRSGNIKTTKGNGILLRSTAQKSEINLLTNQEFGDLLLTLDFMLTKGSSMGIYLQGRYGIKLTDNWPDVNPMVNAMGAIEQRINDEGQPFEGTVPLVNVAKAPGLWQHLTIKFRAPVFKDGVKVTNARFEEVYLNETLIQLQSELTGPTQSAIAKDEIAVGPLMFGGGRGAVAFKNISYTLLDPIPAPLPSPPLSRRRVPVENPIILRVQNKPYLLRGFLMFNNKKRTHVISVGSPDQVSYSYDLKQGALFQIWRGQFLDVTQMWENRGEPQLARPIGSIVPLSVAPVLAFLTDRAAAWPDSIAFDDFHNNGYVLDKSRMPTFIYSYNGADVTDKITVINNGSSLQREITIANGTDNLYCRIAAAKSVVPLKNGIYLIGDKEYYIEVGGQYKPFIRNTSAGQELLVSVGKNMPPLIYSLTW